MSKKFSRKQLLEMAEEEGLKGVKTLNMFQICEKINEKRKDGDKIDCTIYGKERKSPVVSPKNFLEPTLSFEYLFMNEGTFEPDRKYGTVTVPLIKTHSVDGSDEVLQFNNLPYVKLLKLDDEFRYRYQEKWDKTLGYSRLSSDRKFGKIPGFYVNLLIEDNHDFFLCWTTATMITLRKLIDVKENQEVKYIDASGMINEGKIVKFTKKQKGMDLVDYLCIDSDGYKRMLNYVIIV